MLSRRLKLAMLALFVFLLASCTDTPEQPTVPAPTNTPYLIPTNIPTPLPQRAPLLRIAVLGEVTSTNGWEIFDEPGADYWNYTMHSAYWPRLYLLAPPSFDLQPAAAKGTPSSLKCDSDFCTATVNLQPNLKWTDGSPFTANDVAFTVNTALQFRLRLNWMQAYNPDVLDHAEALDRTTVKFYFTRMPTVGEWYYGALQGPIVSQVYWEPRIKDASSLLPADDLLVTLRELEQEFTDLQTRVDGLYTSLDTMAPDTTDYQDTRRSADNLQGELNFVANKTDKVRTEYETKLAEARAALFSLPNDDEPALGAWAFSKQSQNVFENLANLGTPFGDPWFDSVQYITFQTEAEAVQALQKDEVNIILTPDGLSPNSVVQLTDNPAIRLARNSTRSARFLAFNHANPYLADPALHQSLACMLDPQTLNESFDGAAASLGSFVLDDFWRTHETSLPCANLTGDARLQQAVKILKDAGYSWIQEPAPGLAGDALGNPSGLPLPIFTILTPNIDPLRVKAALYISQQAVVLGMSVEVKQVDPDDLFYAVYGSRDYDMALLGWRLSSYPSYLCEWFTSGEQNPFAYSGTNLTTICEAWDQTGELETARSYVSDIQSILRHDLPLIPLYVHVRMDAYRNIYYPFESVLDGLSGLYGAPTFAIPNP